MYCLSDFHITNFSDALLNLVKLFRIDNDLFIIIKIIKRYFSRQEPGKSELMNILCTLPLYINPYFFVY